MWLGVSMTDHPAFEADTVSETIRLFLNIEIVCAVPNTGVLGLCSGGACPSSKLRSHVLPTRAGPIVMTFTMHSLTVTFSATAFLNSLIHPSSVKPTHYIQMGNSHNVVTYLGLT